MLYECTSLEDFEAKIANENRTVFVDVYTPECMENTPIFEKLSAEISACDFLRVNADEIIQMVDHHRIGECPTLLIFRDGKQVEHRSNLRGYDLEKFMRCYAWGEK